MEVAQEVEEYLAGLPEHQLEPIQRLRRYIRQVVPDASESFAWKMPAFKVEGRTLLCYAAFKNHCSFFPMSGSLLEEFQEELKGYRTSKGTLQFPLDKPLPAALVKKLVKARVAQNEAKK